MLNQLRSEVLQSGNEHSEQREGFSVLIAGSSRSNLDQLLSIVECIVGINISTRRMGSGEQDVTLLSDTEQPDLLIYWLGEQWHSELSSLMAHPFCGRTPMIIISECNEQAAMRMAMKVGAIDYLKPPFDAQELQNSINDLMHDQSSANRKVTITSVINAKGGSGASLFACTLAHMMAKLSSSKVSLMDLDIQFGSLCHYFNMESKYGLIEALQNAFELDEVALQGYMLKHESGLEILDIKPGDFLLPEDINSEHLEALLTLMGKQYDQIVVDMPRHLDALSCLVLEKSENIVVVVQQSISHLRDAKRLIHILEDELGIDSSHIMVVLNRYDKHHELSISDIQRTLGLQLFTTVPNAYKVVSQSVNQGEPLYDVASRSAIAKSMLFITDRINPQPQKESKKKGIFHRILPSI